MRYKLEIPWTTRLMNALGIRRQRYDTMIGAIAE